MTRLHAYIESLAASYLVKRGYVTPYRKPLERKARKKAPAQPTDNRWVQRSGEKPPHGLLVSLSETIKRDLSDHGIRVEESTSEK